MKRSGRRARVKISADGKGVVSHAGTALLRELATETGLAGAVTGALLDTYRGFPVHMPGQVFADLAVAIADGADAVTGIEVLRDREALFGPVASMPTAWRLLDRIDEPHLGRVRAARAAARDRAWQAGAAPDPAAELRIDFDATISIAHSEKQNAAATWKKTFGLLTELRELSLQFRSGLRLAPLRSLIMAGLDDLHRDMASLVVPRAGFLQATGGPWDPYRLVDPSGEVVGPVAVYLRDLQAAGRAAATQRSYGMDLLRWFRFCWATGVPWDQATRSEARDFCRWIQIAAKPVSSRWRTGSDAAGETAADSVEAASARRAPIPVTGKPTPGGRYAASTAAHCESVLRQFYDFHLEAGSGPMVNPFPLGRDRRGGRASAHHNPMDAYRDQRSGLFRPRLVQRMPRSIPDERFSELFTQLTSHRDRALVALWVSTGARAAELLGATAGDADAGQQLITVIRKGTRLMQQLPASPDAFVWLRLYQAQMQGLVPGGLDQPLWWTLRRPFRPLTYHAAHRMFTRASAVLGANWTLHDLRHTAASRMARDPAMPLTDVQWVLGHARLSTTQQYVTPLPGDVIASVAAFHARRAAPQVMPEGGDRDVLSSGYRPESLKVLFEDVT